jgi:hypothetical protein
MSDLETRLTEALTEGSRGAPAAVGLATAARTRARARRRTRMAGVAAVAALAVGVPTAVVATQGSDDDSDSPSRVADDPNDDDAGVPDGYRVESWHDVTVLVPEAWGYGSLESWCADGGQLEPRVERPGGVSPAIGCATSTYGLSFQELPPGQDRDEVFDWPVTLQTSEGWPPDAYVGAHGIGDVLVEVIAPTAEQAQAILGTVRALGPEGDPNGCPLDARTTAGPPPGRMSVCRYDASGALEHSELLTGTDKDAAEAALEAAPDATATDCDAEPSQTVRLATEAEDAQIDLSCGSLTVRGEPRALGSDILYWALSPGWSGSVDGDVPLPTKLRQR